MSIVTKSDIKTLFKTNNVKQYGNRNLFLVDGNKLVSYETLIARLIHSPGGSYWLVTDQTYSATTSKHIAFWLRIKKPARFEFGALHEERAKDG